MSARLNPSDKRKADSNSTRPNEKKIRQDDPPRKSKRELIREAYNAQPQPFKSWMSGKNFAGPDTVILKDVKAKEEEKPKKRQEDPNHWHAARERRAWIRARQAKSIKLLRHQRNLPQSAKLSGWTWQQEDLSKRKTKPSQSNWWRLTCLQGLSKEAKQSRDKTQQNRHNQLKTITNTPWIESLFPPGQKEDQQYT